MTCKHFYYDPACLDCFNGGVEKTARDLVCHLVDAVADLRKYDPHCAQEYDRVINAMTDRLDELGVP